MKNNSIKIALLFLFSLTFISCAQNKKETVDGDPLEAIQKNVVSLISPQELNAISETVLIIDVRTPKEYSEGHIPNARNINFYDETFITEMNKLDKTKDIYVYCKVGGRSGKAAKQLQKLGFVKVYDLEGGILNWKKNDLEIDQ